MGFKFRKRIKVSPGIHLNLSKSGVSTSLGGKGATVNVGKKGVKATVGIPGTGISYTENLTKDSSTKANPKARKKDSAAGIWAFVIFILLMYGAFSKKEEDSSYPVGTVTASSLRVREAPNLNADTINQLKRGERVSIIENRGGWSLIYKSGKRGWVSAKYLR